MQVSDGDSAQDVQILAELQKALSNKRFAAVNVSVHDGSVVLAGTVDL